MPCIGKPACGLLFFYFAAEQHPRGELKNENHILQKAVMPLPAALRIPTVVQKPKPGIRHGGKAQPTFYFGDTAGCLFCYWGSVRNFPIAGLAEQTPAGEGALAVHQLHHAPVKSSATVMERLSDSNCPA